MPTVRLTERGCAIATAAEGNESSCRTQSSGLALRVTPAGHKSWIVRYFHAVKGPMRLTLGAYPAAGLADARDMARKTVLLAQSGGDPAGDKRRARLHAVSRPIKTFQDLVEVYFDACERGEYKPRRKQKRARTIADERAILRRHVLNAFGRLRLEDITRRDVKALLRGMVASGITTQTNRTQAIIRQLFAYAISEEHAELNPAAGFSFLVEEKPRARIWSDAELAKLWTALNDEAAMRSIGVSRPIGIAIQLAALTLQREGEIAGMLWSEVDLKQATWLIPASRTKNGHPHLVPLSPTVVALLKEAAELAQDGRETASPCVLPSPRGAGETPIRGHSIGHAMGDIRRLISVDGATVHDLRRTGSTALTSERIGVLPFIRSKVLNHRSDAGGGASVSAMVYDANEYVAEKRRALEAWSALLARIVEDAGTAEGASASAKTQSRPSKKFTTKRTLRSPSLAVKGTGSTTHSLSR